jgi:hypothetical protein
MLADPSVKQRALIGPPDGTVKVTEQEIPPPPTDTQTPEYVPAFGPSGTERVAEFPTREQDVQPGAGGGGGGGGGAGGGGAGGGGAGGGGAGGGGAGGGGAGGGGGGGGDPQTSAAAASLA